MSFSKFFGDKQEKSEKEKVLDYFHDFADKFKGRFGADRKIDNPEEVENPNRLKPITEGQLKHYEKKYNEEIKNLFSSQKNTEKDLNIILDDISKQIAKYDGQYHWLRHYKKSSAGNAPSVMAEQFRNTDFQIHLSQLSGTLNNIKKYYNDTNTAALGFEKISLLHELDNQFENINFRLEGMLNTDLSKETLQQKLMATTAIKSYVKGDIQVDDLKKILDQNPEYAKAKIGKSDTTKLLEKALQVKNEKLPEIKSERKPTGP